MLTPTSKQDLPPPYRCLVTKCIYEAELLLHRHIFHYDGMEHIVGHQRDKGNTTIRVDEYQRTHVLM
jgi:hypothetical protein